MSHRPADTLKDIAYCLVFFTRLPLRFDLGDRKLGEAIWVAPVAGAVVALIGYVAFAALDFVYVPTLPATAIALAAMMLATGCLHEDGLSDVADGFGGGKTLERKLEIMHDSRLGTYGAAALLMSVLIRWSAIANLASHDALLLGLLAAHMASRSIFARLVLDTPLAAQSGLAAGIGPISQTSAWLSLIVGFAALCFLGLFGALATIIALAVVIFGFRHLCLRQIGGINGDALGAAQQLAEITILVAASAIVS